MAKKKSKKKPSGKNKKTAKKSSSPKRTLLAGFDVYSPETGGNYVMGASTETPKICVSGEAIDPHVKIVLLRDSEDFPTDLTNLPNLAVDGSNRKFEHEVTYGGSEATPETGTYKVGVWPVDIDGNVGTRKDRSFNRRPMTMQETVSAKCCLWYAFADPLDAGPFLEEDPVSPFKPVVLRIPANASEVTISVDDQAAEWCHNNHEDCEASSKAPADGGSLQMTSLDVPAYQSSGLGSDVIEEPLEARFCTFVGLWKTGLNYTMFPIGLEVTKNVPPAANWDGWLYLGMHDDQRWFNNEGSIDVTVEWTQEDCSSTIATRLQRPLASNSKSKKRKKGKAKKSKKA